MPAMRLFGRRCSLATDDFLVIGIIDATVFLPWLGWLPVVYTSFLKNRGGSCDDTLLLLLHISLPGLCALFMLNWLLAAMFVLVSSRGTIAKPEPRRHVATLVYVKLAISFMDAVWASLGTVILTRESNFCDVIGVGLLLKACTAFQWFVTLVRLWMMAAFYDWSFSKRTKDRTSKEYFTTPVRRGTFKKWNARLRRTFLWCTSPTDARKQAIETTSELLALLACDLDLVFSDLIAGLHLFTKKCCHLWKSEKMALKEAPLITSSDGSRYDQFPPPHIPDWMNLQLASRYLNLGLGVFGWAWLVYRNPGCGCCMLFKRLTCCFPFRKRSRAIVGDNCCGCQLAGLRGTTSLPYEDVVHASFVDRVFEVPFFVCFDHNTSAVVVSCRGTFSPDDVLTDVAAGFEPMGDDAAEGALCHKGILEAAREVRRRLAEAELLETAFKEKPDYRLVVTGHSLGAAVASILTLLLRREYPDVTCFAFAPPPTLSRSALPLALRHVFVLVYGNDTVPFLNYENVKGIVQKMVKCLQSCDMHKYKVFLSSHKFLVESTSEEKLSNSEIVPKLNGTRKVPDEENNEMSGGDVLEPPCVTESAYVAGTILHIWPTDDGISYSAISLFIPNVCEAISHALKDYIKVPPSPVVRGRLPPPLVPSQIRAAPLPAVIAEGAAAPGEVAGADGIRRAQERYSEDQIKDAAT